MNAPRSIQTLPATDLIKGFILWLSLALPLSLWAAQNPRLNATLDRYIINEGETVLLLIEAEGSPSSEPQLDVLNKDFEVLGTSQSTSLSIINGRRRDSVRWQITLSPRHSGQLAIPAIRVGHQTTKPLSLKVIAASNSLTQGANPGDAAPHTPPSVFLEVIVDNKQPRIQQQVLYTLRLYYDQAITGGSLSDPQADDLLVKRLGEDSNYRSQKHGRSYQVIERRYALFPQRQGKIQIPPPVFDGKIVVSKPQRSPSRNRFGGLFDDVFGGDPFMSMRQSSKRVRLRGDSAELNVAAALGDASTWLPASAVQLTETSKIINRVTLGEPITRTIRIQATGLSAAQLPALSLGNNAQLSKNFKSYPDKASLKDQSNGQDIIGTREQQWALIAQSPGNFTLPAIELQWWNTKTRLTETTRLPARQIEVVAPTGYQAPTQTQPTTPVTLTPLTQPPPSSPDQAGKEMATAQVVTNEPPASTTSQRIKQHGPTVLFALLWLITLVLWLRARSTAQSRQTAATQQPDNSHTHQAAKLALKQLEQAKDPANARKALLAWGKSQFPDNPPNGLTELAHRLNNASISQSLRNIDQALYAPDTKLENTPTNSTNLQKQPSWNARQLSHELGLIKRVKGKQDTQPGDKLPELYKWKTKAP